MPEAVWEMQILVTKCQVQFCLLQKTDEDREVPFLANSLAARKVGGWGGKGKGRERARGASLLAQLPLSPSKRSVARGAHPQVPTPQALGRRPIGTDGSPAMMQECATVCPSSVAPRTLWPTS